MNDNVVFLVRNVAPDSYGGGEIYQLELARELRMHGYKPFILTNSIALIKEAKKEGFDTLIPPYLRRQNRSGWRNLLFLGYWLFQKKLFKWYEWAITKYHPAVVNIQSRDDLIAGTEVAVGNGVKVLWTDHADFRNWVLWNVNVWYKNRIGKRIIELSKKADKVIFVSESVARDTREMIKPLKLWHSTVLCNGVEDRKRLYDNKTPKRDSFVFVGRIVKAKGIEELIKAFDIVCRKYPEASLNIYGNGEDYDAFRKLSNNKRVRFWGETNESLRVLAENEVFVLPSYREGLSLSLLDAAMMKKKIIASDVDGNSEVVVDGKTGLLVPVKNVDRLADVMIWMIEHRRKADEMAENVRARYKARFDFGRIFEEEMLPLYNDNREKGK